MEMRMTLAALRTRMGYTQEEAANLMGVTRNTLQAWEQDSTDIKLTYVAKFAEAYRYPSDGIFFGNATAFSGKLRESITDDSEA